MSSAGQLRERVTFQRRTEVALGDGNTKADWATYYGPCAARIRPKGGSEIVIEQRLSGISIYEITIKSSITARTITPEDRAVNARTGEIYNITQTQNPDEKKIDLVFLCKSGTAEG